MKARRTCLFCRTRDRIEKALKLRGVTPPEGFRVEWEGNQYAVYSTLDGFRMGMTVYKENLPSFWDRPTPPKNGYFLVNTLKIPSDTPIQ